MNIKPFFPVLVALIAVLAYAYYKMDRQPEGLVTAAPDQYIQEVEKNKAARIERAKASRAAGAPTTR